MSDGVNEIALRRYDLDGFECHDRLYQIGDAYRIQETCKGHPDEPAEAWQDVSMKQAVQWLSECPKQFVWPKGFNATFYPPADQHAPGASNHE